MYTLLSEPPGNETRSEFLLESQGTCLIELIFRSYAWHDNSTCATRGRL